MDISHPNHPFNRYPQTHDVRKIRELLDSDPRYATMSDADIVDFVNAEYPPGHPSGAVSLAYIIGFGRGISVRSLSDARKVNL